MNKQLEKRMYFLTMYNISPIQQGIQCGHAQMEYALKHWEDEEFQDWAKNWKTWIILNGGTSNSKPAAIKDAGTMEQHYLTLLFHNKIKCTPFFEPDLNHSLTSIAFIVDERVFNKELYPDYIIYAGEDNSDSYEDWVKSVGGEQNVFLREFLKQFRLA